MTGTINVTGTINGNVDQRRVASDARSYRVGTMMRDG